MKDTRKPRVGVGVIIVKDDKVLLGKRRGSHGAGYWAFPGGHLEFNESVEGCARREVAEETGIRLKNVRKLIYTNDRYHKEGMHYITCFVLAEYRSGVVRNLEPDRCEGWSWFAWGKFPKPLFIPVQNLLKEKQNPLAA